MTSPLDALKRMLSGQAQANPQGLLGSGMAQQGAQAMQSRPYMLHVQEAQALGQQPMTPEQFMLQAQRPKQPNSFW